MILSRWYNAIRVARLINVSRVGMEEWKLGKLGHVRGASPPRKFGMVFVLVRHYQFRHAELLHGLPCVWPPIATIAPPPFHFTNESPESIVPLHFFFCYSLRRCEFLSTRSRIFVKTGSSFVSMLDRID